MRFVAIDVRTDVETGVQPGVPAGASPGVPGPSPVSPASPAVLVIGYGNTLREDDGVGPVAAERLRRLLPPESCRILSEHQLLPELAEPLSRCALAVFIDARHGVPAGLVRRHEVAADPSCAAAGATEAVNHQCDPAALLSLTASLFGRAPAGVVFSVCGGSFGFSERLTPPVAGALDTLVNWAVAEIRRRTSADPPPYARGTVRSIPPARSQR